MSLMIQGFTFPMVIEDIFPSADSHRLHCGVVYGREMSTKDNLVREGSRNDVRLWVLYRWVKILIDNRNAEDLDKANSKLYRAG